MTLDLKLFVLFLSAIITHTDGQPAGLNSKYRLSGNVKPTFYSIKIQPNLDEETFLGEVFMHIKIESSAESIEFHFDCNYLTIIDIHFDTNEIKYFPQFCPWRSDVLTYEFAENELIRIVHGRRAPFAPGAHILHIKYSGKFSDNKEGIFRTECSNNETALSYIVTTDFQPSSARKVFPCFDEPAYKAKFQLSVTVPNDTYNALSNMRVAQTYNTSSGVVHRFETTPPMSIYLLCLVISQHKYIEYIGGNNIPYRLFSYNASQGSIELLEFASKVIEFYSNYTKFDYVLPKIDFIGFDRNQSAATENWGLVTFNTSLLSKYDTVYDQSQKQAVIAHELAHFWFGNLVTNEWWDDIWLHEGVATFMALKAEDWILNNNSSKSFPMIEMDTLYWAEQNETTYPVINYQEIPKEIRKTFNDITYIKGATVLRMLEVAIGERKIQEVFVKYVEKYAFKTVTTDDFLSLVDEVQPSHDLREFMQTYLYQNRFPVISVEEREDEYLLKQKSFGSEDGSEEKKWTIPLTYITDLNSSPVLVWFYKDMEFLSLPRNNSKWIKLNYNQIGYYKANYSSNLWEVFIKDIENIEKTERDNLLLEAANQMEIELISCDIILRYLWELSDVTKNSQFNTNLAFTAYLEIFYIISERDKEATKKLTTFFQKVRARSKRSTTKDILREIETNSTQLKNQTKIEYCIDWLKNESHKYYNASFENKIVS